MKKIFIILTAVCIGAVSFGQTVFQSDLSSWANGDPTDFMNTARTSIASANVVEQTIGATYGTSMASLINTSTSHKRFVTDAITVVPGESYLIEMWVACQDSGELVIMMLLMQVMVHIILTLMLLPHLQVTWLWFLKQ